MGSLILMRMMRNMTVLSGALFFMLLTFPVSAQVRDTVIVTDTSRYVGQFPEGRGVLYSYGNGLYVGEFRNAIPDGKGMHFLPDGSIYAGELSDGKHCGFGRFFSDSGKIFSGEFDDDYANGLDTLWYPDGSVYVGKCVWGRPVSTLSPEYGRMYKGMHVPDYIASLDGEYRQYKKLIKNDTPPKFRGKDANAFSKWVSAQLQYPESEENDGSVKIVKVRFTVDRDGSVQNAHVLESPGEAFSEEALRGVNSSPAWAPGVQKGKKVRFSYTLPVVFRYKILLYLQIPAAAIPYGCRNQCFCYGREDRERYIAGYSEPGV